MGKPAAIERLLRRAKSGTAAHADAGSEAAGFGDEDAGPGGERAGEDTEAPAGPRGDDFDLEAGIASIFAAIRSGAGSGEAREELPEESGATYALLSRLNQLWHAPGQSEA